MISRFCLSDSLLPSPSWVSHLLDTSVVWHKNAYLFKLLIGIENRSISSSTNVLVSPTTFSRKILKTKAKGIILPKTTSEIRATYQNLIEPLKPEHDGKRIGFFTQVEYLVKGIGITAGLLGALGAFYLARWGLQRAH